MTQRSEPSEETTVVGSPGGRGMPVNRPYRPGVAPVQRSAPTVSIVAPTLVGSGWTAGANAPRPPLRYQLRQLKRGWEWSSLGALVAFVCWGIWAISERGVSLFVPVVTFVLGLMVAVGVFALSRLVGRLVLERSLGRIRHTAWPSHLITGLFLAAVGMEYLRRTQWIVEGITWLRALG